MNLRQNPHWVFFTSSGRTAQFNISLTISLEPTELSHVGLSRVPLSSSHFWKLFGSGNRQRAPALCVLRWCVLKGSFSSLFYYNRDKVPHQRCLKSFQVLDIIHQNLILELMPWACLECSLRLIRLEKDLRHRSHCRFTGTECFRSMCLARPDTNTNTTSSTNSNSNSNTNASRLVYLARLLLCIQAGHSVHCTLPSPAKQLPSDSSNPDKYKYKCKYKHNFKYEYK